MPDRLLFASELAATLGAGLVAGVFFAFSTFVMRALAKLPPADGMAAMQSVNVAVINPMFLGAFVGTAALSAAAAAHAAVRWGRPGTGYLLAGAGLYLVGTFLVTVAFNVPLNDALANVPATAGPDAARAWADYVGRWTAWNHVRTAAAALATAAFAMSLRAA